MNMDYYRLVSKKELEEILKTQKILPTENDYPPYKQKNNKVFLLEKISTSKELIKRYGEATAKKRELKKGDKIYLLRISKPPNKVLPDNSQIGWPESRTHKGPIPIKHIKAIGEATLIDNPEVLGAISQVNIYENPIGISKLLKTKK